MRLTLVVALFIAAAIAAFLSFVAWRRRGTAGRPAIYMSICMAGVSVYCFGYAMEVASNTLPEMMFWVRFEHWGIQFLVPTWLLFSLCVAGKEKLITPKLIAAVFTLPFIFFLITQTLGWLNLGHPNPRLDTSGPFPTFAYDRGLFIYVSVAYESLYMAISTALFTVLLFQSAPAFRAQAGIFWVASLIPWCTALLFNFGVTPYHLDLSPLALSVSGLMFALGFFKFRLLDIVPLARDMVFEGMHDGVLVLDTRDRIIDFNPHLQAMLPAVSKTAVGLPISEGLVDYPALFDLLKEDPAGMVEIVVIDEQSAHYYRGTLTPLLNWRKRVMGKIITLYDDTQVKQLLDQLEQLATHDGLTGVYNRRHFNELACKEIYRARRYGKALSLIMLDVDHFKLINDTFGHMAGDAALKALAETFQGMLRQSDIIGRFGGEEFVILLPEIEPVTAVSISEKLRSVLEQMWIEYEGHALDMRASFGVTGVVPPGEVVLEDLMRYADRALYEAKETGRNRVCLLTP